MKNKILIISSPQGGWGMLRKARNIMHMAGTVSNFTGITYNNVITFQ